MLHRTLPRAGIHSMQRPAGSKAVRPVTRVRAATVEEVSSNGAVAHSSPLVVDFDELSEIIKMVHDTDIIELELKSKKFNLSLRKKEALQSEQPTVQYVQAPPQGYAPPPPPAPAPAPEAAVSDSTLAAAEAAAAPAPPPPPAKIQGVEITSPMSGTFYKAAAPGDPAFVKEGDRVKKGQVVGIIEAMKLMNEIEAEVSGEVVKILVDNGTPVSPGMPLILIRP